jgi:acyl carrier protein
MKNVEERVRAIIAEHLDVEESRVTLDALVIEDLGADSLDCIETIMAIEQEFQCEISDEEAENVVTVGDAVALVTRAIPRTQ